MIHTFAARHPIAIFLVPAISWSFAVWSLMWLYIAPGGLSKDPPPVCFAFVVIGGFGPSIAGLLATGLADGSRGLWALWARVRAPREGRWWLALLLIPAVTALTPLLRAAAGYPVDTSAMVGLLGPGAALGLTAGLMEEIGWRGYLLPRLLERHSPAKATLLLGLVWGGLWHGYADYFALGGRGLASLALIVLLGPVLLTAWSLVMTWVYERTEGSLLVAYFMHASISSSALVFGQTYTSTEEELAWTALGAALACLTAEGIWRSG